MARTDKVLLVTGFAPLQMPQLEGMGVFLKPLLFLTQGAEKRTLRFSMLTLGAAVVGTFLRDNGIEVGITDYYLDGADASGCDIVGISSTFLGMENVQEIASAVKAQNPAATVVMGGPLSWSVSPQYLLQSVPQIDFIVQREGEATLLELVQTLWAGGDCSKVAGLVFRSDGGIIDTPLRAPMHIEDVCLDWGLMPFHLERRLPVLPIETSRGCVYDCAVCSETHYWGKPVRFRQPKSVVAEIKRNVNEFGIHTFRFVDSCFSAPARHCIEVCDAIFRDCISEGQDVKWTSYARVNDLSPELMTSMKRAGCVALDVGMESGDPEILRKMGRHYQPEQIVSVAETARSLGVLLNYNVVVGFPGETQQTIEHTVAVLRAAKPDTYSCFILFVAPHMHITDSPDDYGLKGQGLNWEHQTMNSREAAAAMLRISDAAPELNHFPGGEYLACFLTSLGFSVDQIRRVYWATNELCRDEKRQEAWEVIRDVRPKIDRYW